MMAETFLDNRIDLHCGDCREVLATLPDESVHCVVTSPPYFGLRDYGIAEQLGLEATPDAYVAEMVAVFREVRRVLRKDGTLWLNLGDSYATSPPGNRPNTTANSSGLQNSTANQEMRRAAQSQLDKTKLGLPSKNLLGIPWRVAFALQADGWYLRQDIIWHKPNPMPESVTDRCTKAHEYLFLLSKNERYYYDAKAIEEPLAEASAERYGYAFGGAKSEALIEANKTGVGQRTRVSGERDVPTGRNKRSVWSVTTEPFTEAHFATFPSALIEPCILAGCPKGGTVLDPFSGAGTAGLVADRLGRSAILIELNPTYAAMTERRIKDDAGMFANIRRS